MSFYIKTATLSTIDQHSYYSFLLKIGLINDKDQDHTANLATTDIHVKGDITCENAILAKCSIQYALCKQLHNVLKVPRWFATSGKQYAVDTVSTSARKKKKKLRQLHEVN